MPTLLLDEVFSTPPGDFDDIRVWKSMLSVKSLQTVVHAQAKFGVA